MFTKRHFEKVAAIIKNRQPSRDNQITDYHTLRVALSGIADDFADEFQASNENFDRRRFMKACGFE